MPRTRRDSSSDSSSDRDSRSSCRDRSRDGGCRTCRQRSQRSPFASSSDRGKERGRGRRGRRGPRQEGSDARSRSRSCGKRTTEGEGSRRLDQTPDRDRNSEMEAHGSADRVSPTGHPNGSEEEDVNTCDSDSSDCDASSSSSDYGSDTGSNTGRPQDMDEISLNMAVLARRSPFTWERGKICEIVPKGNGKLKYRIDYDQAGRALLHGHHIAFDEAPILQQLYIGARVVAKYPDDTEDVEDNQSPFRPGVLAELPTIKNKKRFLVFFDDHTPCYVSLPLLRLVCRPLKNVWEDIPDSAPRSFIEEYLKFWPNEPLASCKVGDITYLDVNGIQRSCEVQQIENSLVQVAFQDDEHKEWIYRGKYISRLRFMKKHGAKGKHKDKPASRPAVTGPPSDLEEGEVSLNMPVLAKRGALKHWQPGKICEIVEKDHGKIKYKIDFEDKGGRCLNSGHHIAFDEIPSGRERLYISARVVAKYPDDESRFYPGILAELPTRQNKMRFLVFFDDGTPSYVNLPHLRLVCRRLKNVWEDIPRGAQRNFIEEYVTAWPTDTLNFKVGQMIEVELHGIPKSCQVQQLNCSLVEVVFQDDQHKEWIYRGSNRIISHLKKRVEKEDKDKKKDKKSRTNRRRPPGKRLVSR